MLESQRVLFELRESLERRYSTGISWSPDRQQSKNRTSLRRSRLDELRLEERNEARFLLEYLVCRLLLEKKNQQEYFCVLLRAHPSCLQHKDTKNTHIHHVLASVNLRGFVS